MDHPGVQGEASRILAWIVKNCNGNEAVITSLLKANALQPLVILLSSEHCVMVNIIFAYVKNILSLIAFTSMQAFPNFDNKNI